MVGKMLFITETSSYNKLDVLKASRVIRFADNSDLGMAGSILGDGIWIQNGLPKSTGMVCSEEGEARRKQVEANPLQQVSSQLYPAKRITHISSSTEACLMVNKRVNGMFQEMQIPSCVA